MTHECVLGKSLVNVDSAQLSDPLLAFKKFRRDPRIFLMHEFGEDNYETSRPVSNKLDLMESIGLSRVVPNLFKRQLQVGIWRQF